MGQYSFDVGSDDFQRIVIEGSKQAPVVVDFWAEWCGPCRMLKPILEKLADEYGGKFILAKVNTEQFPDLAGQFGVRGIPNVTAFSGGQLVDEFSGALPEAAVREFLERLIPSPAEELRLKAMELRDAGEPGKALQVLAEASKLDMGNELIRLDAAEILIEQGQNDEAKRLLDSLSPATLMEARPQQLLARLNFALAGESSGDEQTLRARIAARPDDMETRLQLANLLVAGGRPAAGMDELLEMIRLDRAWNDETARKTMLSVFSVLGGSPLVAEYRRKLASALN
ncbi:MAG TPA: co-chaperone YbbN [Thiobacillaceae bacterium]|nr:co-chaperone YbbN [Thiobacillaceae bacterium]